LTVGGARQLPASAFVADPKGRQHWWVESALEPLTAEHIVFVEGISDRIIVHAVAQLLGFDLDRLGVTVVALNGAGNFRPAIRLFGPTGFGIQLLGLVDQNEAPIPADALGVTVADLPSHDVLVCVGDLEEEYASALGVADIVAVLVASGLFTEAGIKVATGVSDVTSLSAADLAKFVLRKNKVEAAAALADAMTPAQASSLVTVNDLVRRAVG